MSKTIENQDLIFGNADEKYSTFFSLKDKTIEAVLKDKRCLKGTFVGFTKQYFDGFVSRIVQWQYISDSNSNILGLDSLIFLFSEETDRNEINEIRFLENNSVLKFQ